MAAAALLFASTGAANRDLSETSSWVHVAVWAGLLSGLWLLHRFKVFAAPNRVLYLILSISILNTGAQATGGVASPAGLLLFLVLSLAAWNGRVKLELGGAALYGALEAVATWSVTRGLEPHLYLRWLTFLLFAFLLGQAVKMKAEKDRLEERLSTLENEAGQMALDEPTSIDLSKDRLLQEETRLALRMNAVMELEGSLKRSLDLFRQMAGLHTAACFLVSPIEGRKVLRLRAFSSLSDTVAADVAIVPGETLVGLAAKEGRRVVLDPLSPESARALPYYRGSHPVRSFLSEPITLEDPASPEQSELAGLLVFDSSETGAFTSERVSQIESFSRGVAEIVQSVRILHFSGVKTRNLHALYEVSKRYSTMITPDEVIRTALETARGILPCDSTCVALASESGDAFEVKAWWGAKPEKGKGNEGAPALERDLTAWILKNRRPIRYNRGTKDPAGPFVVREGALGPMQSFLMVPLISGENVLGILRVDSAQPGAYQAWDEDVLSTLANQAATALEKAFLVQQMEEMAIRDGLTGVYNHRYFQERLEDEIAKAERYNKDLGLLLLDVDHFKKFNDQYGHPEGDRVLKTVSQLLQETVRKRVDTVARYGGEEFVVILPEADVNASCDLAERIRKRIEGHLFENGKGTMYRVTVSLGQASYPFDARTASRLINASDTALYESKAQGRNRVTAFSRLEKKDS